MGPHSSWDPAVSNLEVEQDPARAAWAEARTRSIVRRRAGLLVGLALFGLLATGCRLITPPPPQSVQWLVYGDFALRAVRPVSRAARHGREPVFRGHRALQ